MAAEPVAAEPVAAEPVAAEPGTAEPGTAEPGTAEPGPGQERPGWIWGEPSDGNPDPPPDAPLHVLLLAASRIMGTFYAGTLTQADRQALLGWLVCGAPNN